MTDTPFRVRRLNDTLRQDLGDRPLFQWHWSENLQRVMKAVDEQGQPIFEFVEQNGVYIAQQATAVRKLESSLNNQWVICQRLTLGDGAEIWLPVWARNGIVALDVNEEPKMAHTWRFITGIRAWREEERRKEEEKHYNECVSRTTLDDNHPEWGAHWSNADRKKYESLHDQIKDSNTAFHEVPGSKGGTSYGGIKDSGL